MAEKGREGEEMRRGGEIHMGLICLQPDLKETKKKKKQILETKLEIKPKEKSRNKKIDVQRKKVQEDQSTIN